LDNEQIGNAVLLSYIEEAKSKVWINVKTGIAMELAIKENKKKADLPVEKLIQEDLHDFLDVFNDNKANWFPELTCGTTRLIWKKDLNQNLSRTTIWHWRNKNNWTNSWTKIWKKNIFNHPSQLKCYLFFLSKRRMEDFDHVKIIGTWMTGWLKTHILYLWFQKSWTSWKEKSTFQNLTYDGAIITFESNLEINGKPHSKQIEDYINPLSCSLECVISRQPSKLWWTRYSKKKLKRTWLLSIWTTFWYFPKWLMTFKKSNG
jgi:hypothetical protein